MILFQILLVLATLFCSLVAGFLFAFAVVIMPGIRSLPDREFIRAFQVMDGVIQNNQPLFILVWVGSVLSLLGATVFGLWQLDGLARILLVVATFVYLVGVQLPTLAVNVPLNNQIQRVDASAADASATDTIAHKEARDEFESRWNYWNSVRTILAILVSVLVMMPFVLKMMA